MLFEKLIEVKLWTYMTFCFGNCVLCVLTTKWEIVNWTARALTMSPSMLYRGGVYLVWGGVCSSGGVYLVRVVSAAGVYLVRYSPHGQTDACKLITLPQTSFAGGNKSNHDQNTEHHGASKTAKFKSTSWKSFTVQDLIKIIVSNIQIHFWNCQIFLCTM